MEPNVVCVCGTFYAPSLAACSFCGRFKQAGNILGTSISRWDEWLAKQGESLPFDDSLDALEHVDYDEDEADWCSGPHLLIDGDKIIDMDSTGNANIDAFLKGMRW